MNHPHEHQDPCPDCGSDAALVAGRHLIRRTVGGRAFERDVAALICPNCKTAYVASDVRDDFDRYIAQALLEDGVRTSDAFPLFLDAFEVDPTEIGTTWRDVKAWRQKGAEVPDGVWVAFSRAIAPPPALAYGLGPDACP